MVLGSVLWMSKQQVRQLKTAPPEALSGGDDGPAQSQKRPWTESSDRQMTKALLAEFPVTMQVLILSKVLQMA